MINFLSTSSIKIHTVVIEDPINLAVPAQNGEAVMRDVLRKMLPNANGTSMASSTTVGGYKTFTSNYTIPTTGSQPIVKENLHVVVFVQDNSNKEILQAAKFSLGSYGIKENNTAISQLVVYPNPFSSNAQVYFNLTKTENVRIDVYNVIGKNVYSSDNVVMNVGEHNLQLNAQEWNAGMYFVTLTAGDHSMTQKISIER